MKCIDCVTDETDETDIDVPKMAASAFSQDVWQLLLDMSTLI